MDKIDELLKYVQRTNPKMTRKKLINELSVSRYVTAGLLHTMECLERTSAKENFRTN